MVIERGEIWWAELPEPGGSEPGYSRPEVSDFACISTKLGSSADEASE